MNQRPIKLAFVTGIFPRMSETFVLSQIEHAVEQGFEVSIFASECEEGTDFHPAVTKHDLLSRTHYYGTIGSWVKTGWLERCLNLPGTFLRTENKLPLLKSLNPWRFGRIALSLRVWSLADAFADLGLQDYDLVHCQFGPYGVFCAKLKQLGIIQGRLLTSFHGYDMSQHLQNAGDHIYDNLFRVGDGFLPISDHWREKLIKMGCPREKVMLHRMGIDTQIYTYRTAHSDYLERIQILTIGRLVEKKGIEIAIRALAEIVHRCPGITYTIVGDGPLREDLESLTRELGLADHVVFAGWRSQQEIRQYIGRASVMVAPSVTARDGDQEGIPMVLMEAMASGLPVISTYHSGIPELIQDNVSGRLVPERDVEGLAQAIVQLASNKELRDRFSKAGRKRVEANFDLSKLNSQLVAIYRQNATVSA